MKCPNCTDTVLVMAERQGVEIDYCPNCRGVWLDRGELDKIIEKAAAQDNAAIPQQPGYQSQPVPQYQHKHTDEYYKHKHKQKNWLSELFD